MRLNTAQAPRWLYGILLLALALRFGLMLSLAGTPGQFLQSDAGGYDQIASNLISQGVFSSSGKPPYAADAFRTPVYPFFLAGIFVLFGHSYLAVVFIQGLLSTASVYLVFHLGRMMVGRVAGLIAALFTALDVGLIVHANLLLTETLYTLLLILALLAMWSLLQSNRLRFAVAGGILLGLGTLCRPLAQYLPLGFVVLVFVFARQDWPRRLLSAALLLVFYGVVLAPWLVRNWLVFGTPQLSSIQGYNLLYFNAGYLRAQLEHTTLEQAQLQLEQEVKPALAEVGDNPFRQASAYQIRALREIRQHPWTYLRLHAQGAALMLALPNTNFLANMWGILSTPTGLIANLRTRTLSENIQALSQFFRAYLSGSPKQALFLVSLGVEIVTLIVIYFLALIGLVDLVRSKHWLTLGLLIMPLVYFVALTGPVGYGRYRIPAMPILALLAGAGLAVWLNRRTSEPEPVGRNQMS